jgi:hypothetical protein
MHRSRKFTLWILFALVVGYIAVVLAPEAYMRTWIAIVRPSPPG